MKHIFIIAAIWFFVSQSCNQHGVGTQKPQKQEPRKLKVQPDSMALVSDSLKHELCFRIYQTEKGLDALKKKRFGLEGEKHIESNVMRAIDPVYYKSHNPPN